MAVIAAFALGLVAGRWRPEPPPAIRTGPAAALDYVGAGSGYQRGRQYKKAEAEFERALVANPREHTAASGLARLAEERGDQAQARQAWTRAIAIADDAGASAPAVDYRCHKAQICCDRLRDRDPGESRALYEEVSRDLQEARQIAQGLYPWYRVQVECSLAEVELTMGRLAERGLDPKAAASHYAMALAYARNARQIMPDSPQFRRVLAEAESLASGLR